MDKLLGKTALITGCNRGIGKAIAEKFASEGANLICAIRKENPEFKAETDTWAAKYGVKIDFVYFDLTDEDAIKTAKQLAELEGIMCGISSGTNVAAAIKLAEKLGKGKTVVTILPDTAERYFSTPLFE